MQITDVRTMVAKVLVAGVLAGAVVMAAPAMAGAQEICRDARFAPAYAPAYENGRSAYNDRFVQARDARVHEEWEQGHVRFQNRQDRRFDAPQGGRSVHDQFRRSEGDHR